MGITGLKGKNRPVTLAKESPINTPDRSVAVIRIMDAVRMVAVLRILDAVRMAAGINIEAQKAV